MCDQCSCGITMIYVPVMLTLYYICVYICTVNLNYVFIFVSMFTCWYYHVCRMHLFWWYSDDFEYLHVHFSIFYSISQSVWIFASLDVIINPINHTYLWIYLNVYFFSYQSWSQYHNFVNIQVNCVTYYIFSSSIVLLRRKLRQYLQLSTLMHIQL